MLVLSSYGKTYFRAVYGNAEPAWKVSCGSLLRDHNNSSLFALSQTRVASYSDRAWARHSPTADSGIVSPVYSVRFLCLRKRSRRTIVWESVPSVEVRV